MPRYPEPEPEPEPALLNPYLAASAPHKREPPARAQRARARARKRYVWFESGKVSLT
jgi:hypothetical protein